MTLEEFMKKDFVRTDIIEGYRKERGLSIASFCKLCRIGCGTYYKILRQDDSVNIVAVFKIAKIMEVRVCELFY